MQSLYEKLKQKNEIDRINQLEKAKTAKFLPNLPEPLKKPRKPRKQADPFSVNYEADKTRLEQIKPIKGKNMHKFKAGYKETLDKLYQDVFSIVVSSDLLHQDNTFSTMNFVPKLNEMRTDRMKVKYDLPTVVLFTEMEGGDKVVCWFLHEKVLHAFGVASIGNFSRFLKTWHSFCKSYLEDSSWNNVFFLSKFRIFSLACLECLPHMLVQAHFEKFAFIYGGSKKIRKKDKFVFWKYEWLENMCACTVAGLLMDSIQVFLDHFRNIFAEQPCSHF